MQGAPCDASSLQNYFCRSWSRLKSEHRGGPTNTRNSLRAVSHCKGLGLLVFRTENTTKKWMSKNSSLCFACSLYQNTHSTTKWSDGLWSVVDFADSIPCITSISFQAKHHTSCSLKWWLHMDIQVCKSIFHRLVHLLAYTVSQCVKRETCRAYWKHLRVTWPPVGPYNA